MGLAKALGHFVQCHGCAGRPQLSYPPIQVTRQTGTGGEAGSQRHVAGGLEDHVLTKLYEPVQQLGSGGVGTTWLMRHKASSEMVAVKLIKRPLPELITTSTLREITNQARLAHGHCGIVNPREVLLTPKHVAIVMEYCSGGTLLQLLDERVTRAQSTGLYMSEDEARYFFRQLIDAISYCHEHHVVHRDIKLENTLLDGSRPPHIKLTDFGTSRETSGITNCYTHVGTPVYMSPEMLAKERQLLGYNGPAQDVWACGVLLSAMLFGVFPFDVQEADGTPVSEAEREHDIWTQQVTRSWGEHPVLGQVVNKLSPEFKDLLNSILQPDESKRASMACIKAHPWFTKPLIPRFQAGWDEIETLQAANAGRAATQSVDKALLSARNRSIEELVKAAKVRVEDPGNSNQLLVVDLRESSIMSPCSACGGAGVVQTADSSSAQMGIPATVPEDCSVHAGVAHTQQGAAAGHAHPGEVQ